MVLSIQNLRKQFKDIIDVNDLNWEIEGVAIAYLIANIIWFYFGMNVPAKLINMNFNKLLFLLSKIFSSSIT